MTKPYIGILQLGCDKNRVDSERIASLLTQYGFQILWLHDLNQIHQPLYALIINTCGFILPAQQQSIDTIIEAIHKKQQGRIQQILVMGCLVPRFQNQLQHELPEVDHWIKPEDFTTTLRALGIQPAQSCHQPLSRTFLSTPKHYAYVKISEGCNRKCAFCAIPLMRGKHRSYPPHLILHECQQLINRGVRELLLVAQDPTAYGQDLQPPTSLTHLLEQLGNLQGTYWLRLHYLHPRPFPKPILHMMRDPAHPLVPYLDMPVQHTANHILQSMRRGTPLAYLSSTIEQARSTVPNLCFRTAVIIGFPGESPHDLDLLMKTLENWQVDRLGIFTYSHEEGTHAYKTLRDHIPHREKIRRHQILSEFYQQVLFPQSVQRMRSTHPNGIPTIIDEIYDDQTLIARTWWDAPEIDAYLWLSKPQSTNPKPGTFLLTTITSYIDLDLFGEPLPNTIQPHNSHTNTATNPIHQTAHATAPDTP